MGSHFVRHLAAKYPHYQIFNLDLLTYAGNPENLADLEQSERYHFIRGDIGDKILVEDLFAKHSFDAVIDFTAESHVDRSIVDAFQFIKTNVQGAYVLLETVRQRKIPRFLYISTDEIYGDIPLLVKTPESYPFNPTNPYAASKAAADLMVQAFIKTHKVPALIVRSSNNFGSHQYPEKLHSLVITNLLEGKKIPVHGSGSHVRSWVHVQDFCDAVDCIMHEAEDFKIYNVAGEEKSNMEVLKAIAHILGKDATEYAEYVPDRPGADFRYAADDSKIHRELGWQPRHTYEDSIEDVVRWYVENKDWWQKIKQKREFLEHYEKQSRGQYDL